MVKPGIQCRLFGRDFPSVAEAARHHQISHSWARELVHAGKHQNTCRDSVRNNWSGKFKKTSKAQTSPV